MRDFGKVSGRFWIGETGKLLRGDPEAQVVAVYLMTAPTANMTGLYYLPLSVIAHETGIPLEGASKALRRVVAAGFAMYDADAEEVWVPEMAAHQIAESLKPTDNRVTGLMRELEQYRKSKFIGNFYERYGQAYSLQTPPNLPPPRKPLASPSEAPCKPLRSQEKEKEQENEQEQEREAASAAPPLALVPDPEPEPDDLGEPASAAERTSVHRHAREARGILDALNAARKRVRTTARGIKASYTSLAGICDRLDAGKTVEDCLHVIAVCEAESRDSAKSYGYFDAVSPWRPENFERYLARDAGETAAAADPDAAAREARWRRSDTTEMRPARHVPNESATDALLARLGVGDKGLA